METTMLPITNEVEGLPIIPTYTPGELTQAHLQRIADKNFIGLPEVSRLLKKFVASKYPRLDPQLVKPTLAALLGHPDDVVGKLRLTDYLVVPSNQAAAKQVCPICLAEDMPAHLLLAEPAYGICHFHRVTHVYRCASCSRRLTWGKGDYLHCQCGFDLRLSPTICVDSDTCSLYLSCLLDQSLNAVNGVAELKGYEEEGVRLRTTLAYLIQDKGIQSDTVSLQHEMSTAVQSEALQWLAIGMRIGNDSTKLNDVVAGIEARHIWGPAQPEWVLTQSQDLTDSITWEPLRLLSKSAQSIAMEYQPDCDTGSVIAAFDDGAKLSLERMVRNDAVVSSFLRNEVLFEIHRQKSLSGVSDSDDCVRLNTLVEMTRNLRWIDDARWDLQVPISGSGEILSFIAAGVFHPSIASAIEHWHVDQHQVADVFQKIWRGQWPEVTTIEDDAYVLMFDQVFKPNIKPSDWACLPLVDIERRVLALLRGDSLLISGWRHSGSQLSLPLGFCAFLSNEDCDIYCDPEKYQFDSFGLICPTWQKAAAALINACRRAQDHMRGLVGWPKLSTQVAEQYQLGDPWDKHGTRTRIKANALIARSHPYPYKTLDVALRSGAYQALREPKASVHRSTANAVQELPLTRCTPLHA
jgi:hypothetical protein